MERRWSSRTVLRRLGCAHRVGPPSTMLRVIGEQFFFQDDNARFGTGAPAQGCFYFLFIASFFPTLQTATVPYSRVIHHPCDIQVLQAIQ
eukprot:2074790-Pyramimonas_sp.AAC.1